MQDSPCVFCTFCAFLRRFGGQKRTSSIEFVLKGLTPVAISFIMPIASAHEVPAEAAHDDIADFLLFFPPPEIADHFTEVTALSIPTAAAMALNATVLAQRTFTPSPYPKTQLADLISRITMGFNEAELTQATALGYKGYLERQLKPESIDDSQNENAILTQYPFLNWTTAQLLNGASNIQTALTRATLQRAIFSKRQLLQRMVEFWADHFNISIGENGLPECLRTEYDWAVLRPYALDTFPNLLRAVAHSAAMMVYLNNDLNIAGIPNENYARELMELHTMGADTGYTQQDVEEIARCLTGWGTSSWGGGFAFQFHPAQHDNGAKTVLGHPIPANGGQNDGELVLDILANHPNTAFYIGRKLLRWLLGYTPSPKLVEGIAQVYIKTGGDIKEMIRFALTPDRLAAKTPKFKRPFHLWVSTFRALNAQLTFNADVLWRLDEAGQMPFRWDPPNGYPDALGFWSGLMLPRWNFATSLMDTGITGVTYDVATITQGATTASAIATRIDAALFGGRMRKTDKAAITQYLLPDPPNSRRIKEAIGLALASPSFQWY